MRAPPELALLRPGFRLDRYELLCPLAYGGMAAVWLARFGGKLGFEKLVVVKTILPQFASEPQFQKMFVDESRIASGIEHTNVARILDVGEQDEILYIVMEWIDGESLSRLQRAVEKRGGKLPAGVVLRLLADACAGLHAAHELRDKDGQLLGVVHRDVSPQNILVSTQGAAKIIDFGVAKARDRATPDTTAGQLKGKIRYMSPEHALGQDVDRRSDVWSLGALMYELFAGAPPYDEPNEIAALHQLTSGTPPRPLPRAVPAPVAAIVSRALGYHPNERFSSAEEMRQAIENAISDLRVSTSCQQVAAFMAEQMAERMATRKRAVEAALAAAAALHQGTPGAEGSRGGSHGDLSPNHMGERPSHASTATLGSAAVEWPSQHATPARRRRALGLAIALGLVSALVVGTMELRAVVATRRAQTPPVASVAPPRRASATDIIPYSPPPSGAAATAPSVALMPDETETSSSFEVEAVAPPRTGPNGSGSTRTRAPRTPKSPDAGGAKPKQRDYGF